MPRFRFAPWLFLFASLFVTAIVLHLTNEAARARAADGDSKGDTAKTDTAKTDTAKTDTGKSDTAKTDAQVDLPAPDPAALLAPLTIPADLAVDVVLTEPIVAQPLFITFDARGRMWVVQYRQYPFPAGLTVLSQDKFRRMTFDRMSPPPPNHFRGADRITIHEDTDGDGVFDKHKTFVEGLNITTSVAPGRGGVWVLNPPYLLFYPDKNGDDVPDGDPEVHLEGFGIEDTHSNANSLCFGPDGWLYGCMGSTVSGHIRRPGLDKEKDAVHSLGQLVWRYHPETRKYEIFAEGGGNAFGLEIDSRGRVFSGHNGGDTRGFHYVQGGYYQKGFSKHGELSNPYAFGYFAAMKHPSVPRFTHDFVIYEGAALPSEYDGAIFGVHPLGSHVVVSQLFPDSSSFQSKDLKYAIQSSDVKFRPVFITTGPDGAMYVGDFFENRIDHHNHHMGNVTPNDGRIYRIRAKDGGPAPRFDLAARSSVELIDALKHPNKWFRRTAQRLLGDRRDGSILPRLKTLLGQSEGQFALEILWAIHNSGGLDEATTLAGLGHAEPWVRAWTVRLACDAPPVSEPLARRLAAMARTEAEPIVRGQLASSARRLPTKETLAIIEGLFAHDADVDDIHVPLLLWWAIESKCEQDREYVLALFSNREHWARPLVAKHLVHRLMKRFAQAGKRQDLLTCARLLEMAPDEESRKKLMQGFEEAFQGRPLAGLPDELSTALAKSGSVSPILSLRQGNADAVADALKTIADDKSDKDRRLLLIQIFGEVKQPSCVPTLVNIVGSAGDDGFKIASLVALSPYDDPRVEAVVLEKFGSWSDDVRAVALSLLASRKRSAAALLGAVDAGQIGPERVPLDVVRRLTVYNDESIKSLVGKHWGAVEGATTEEMQKEIERLSGVVSGAKGSPYDGKKLYMNSCGKCHKLFGQGGAVGPDLTSFKRDDVARLLVNIVNPSAEIREGFETFMAVTDDGRTVTGFLADRDNQVVVLKGADGQNITLQRGQIEELSPVKKSIMPEGQLKELTEQQVRDLFAYLRSSQPLNE